MKRRHYTSLLNWLALPCYWLVPWLPPPYILCRSGVPSRPFQGAGSSRKVINFTYMLYLCLESLTDTFIVFAIFLHTGPIPDIPEFGRSQRSQAKAEFTWL